MPSSFIGLAATPPARFDSSRPANPVGDPATTGAESMNPRIIVVSEPAAVAAYTAPVISPVRFPGSLISSGSVW